ncbi:MAG TPA: hypothetical protein VKZ51_06710 [Cyclobacteriaceae bacterium]|nr:hypothetical protein [Cyclobacteriaceae bacterium]
MRNSLQWFCFLLVLAQFSCGNSKKENQSEIPESDVAGEQKQPAVTFETVETGTFPEASIEMYSPLGNETFREGPVPFEFNIKNYPKHGGNFSFKMSVNGGEPGSYTTPVFKQQFNSGAYRAVAFLLDRNGLALKEYGNYVDRDFLVGDSRPFPDSDEPYMILNLPGDRQVFSPQDTVIVDFLLIGGGLEEDGLKFVLSVDGEEQDVHELLPIKINNLQPGVHEVQVKLVKNTGEELSGIFSTARRTITVEK